MNLRSLTLATLLLGIVAGAFADDDGGGDNEGNRHRKFYYSGIDAVNGDYSGQGNAAFKVRTRVVSIQYLYVQGNFGASWKITGWGAGSDTRSETVTIFHNENVQIATSNFADLAKTEGTKTGTQSIGLAARLRFSVGSPSGKVLLDTGLLPAANLNQTWGSINSADTDGKLAMTITRKITLDAGVGPGTYENLAAVTFTRN